MKEDDPDLFDKYYSEGALACFLHATSERTHDVKFHDPEALQAKIGTLSLEAQTKLEKETKKKEAKAEAKADAALKKKLASQVRSLLLSSSFLFKIPNSTGNDQEDRAYEAQARHRYSRSRGIWHRSQKGGQAARWAVCDWGLGNEECTRSRRGCGAGRCVG